MRDFALRIRRSVLMLALVVLSWPAVTLAAQAPERGAVRAADQAERLPYARAGMVELGGSAFVTRATDFTQIQLSPQVGWFVLDRLELSALLGVHFQDVPGRTTTLFTALVEPSWHQPFGRTVYAFAGLGAGLAYAEGPGAGVAIAPRMGVNLVVGRSGVVTPTVSLTYVTHDAHTTPAGTLVEHAASWGLGLGYSVVF